MPRISRRTLTSYSAGAILTLIVASSWGMAQEPKPIGTWVFSEGNVTLTLKFNSDGTAQLQNKPFKFTAGANRLVMIDEQGVVSNYTYEVSGDALTVLSRDLPRTITFLRQRESRDDALGNALKQSPGQTPGSRLESKEDDTGLVGLWKSDAASVQIFKDGKLTINGEPFSYRVDGRFITLTSNEGSARVEFQLKGDTLITNYQGERNVYQRVKDDSNATGQDQRANPAELAGKWCYMSNVTANNGGRMSNTCVTLYPNGTYEYYSETSSSNPNGSTASESSDSGTWSVAGSSLVANSRSRGRVVYTLEKRNHPKTGDPMLVIDGDAFVTYAQRRPW